MSITKISILISFSLYFAFTTPVNSTECSDLNLPSTLSENMGIYIPKLLFTRNNDEISGFWTYFSFYGQAINGDLLWKLDNYGAINTGELSSYIPWMNEDLFTDASCRSVATTHSQFYRYMDTTNGCSMNWYEANNYCISKGGRLPTITELESTYMSDGGDNYQKPPGFNNWFYWSGTTSGNDADYYRFVDYGERIIRKPKDWDDHNNTVRCVRQLQNDNVNSHPPEKGQIATSCRDAMDNGITNRNGTTGDGFYQIDPDGSAGDINPFYVYCDMTHEGGGWTLYAHHADGIESITEQEEVKPSQYGVMTRLRWQALRDSMVAGMMFIDEYENIAAISAPKLRNGNCMSVQQIDNLPQTNANFAKVWHHENSGCNTKDRDYSVIFLSDSKDDSYNTRGASLYQLSSVKFNKWPYKSAIYSLNEQDVLLYFIK